MTALQVMAARLLAVLLQLLSLQALFLQLLCLLPLRPHPPLLVAEAQPAFSGGPLLSRSEAPL